MVRIVVLLLLLARQFGSRSSDGGVATSYMTGSDSVPASFTSLG